MIIIRIIRLFIYCGIIVIFNYGTFSLVLGWKLVRSWIRNGHQMYRHRTSSVFLDKTRSCQEPHLKSTVSNQCCNHGPGTALNLSDKTFVYFTSVLRRWTLGLGRLWRPWTGWTEFLKKFIDSVLTIKQKRHLSCNSSCLVPWLQLPSCSSYNFLQLGPVPVIAYQQARGHESWTCGLALAEAETAESVPIFNGPINVTDYVRDYCMSDYVDEIVAYRSEYCQIPTRKLKIYSQF